jgi:hypothetical protein
MTTDQMADALVERNTDPVNLETMAKVAFLRERGVWGMRLNGAVTAVANRHRTCLEMIQMGDQFGGFGDKARRKSVENLIDAENKLRSKVDGELRKRRLNTQWEAYRASNFPNGYEVDQAVGEEAALRAPGIRVETRRRVEDAPYRDRELRRKAHEEITKRQRRQHEERLNSSDPETRWQAATETAGRPRTEEEIRREIDRILQEDGDTK